jgi:hypothetical protein
VIRIFVRDIVPDDLGGHKPVFCINTAQSLRQRKGRWYPVVARVAIPVDAQEESRQILKLVVVEERVAARGWWVFEVVEGGVGVVVQRRAQVNCDEVVSAQQFWQSRRYQVRGCCMWDIHPKCSPPAEECIGSICPVHSMLQQQDWREVRQRVGGHERPVSAAMQEKGVVSRELLECAFGVLEVSSSTRQPNQARGKVGAILRSRLGC